MTTTDIRLFDEEANEDYHRGFAAGVLFEKLREDKSHVTWLAKNADVESCVRMAQGLGYRVKVGDADMTGWRTLTFTSTEVSGHA